MKLFLAGTYAKQYEQVRASSAYCLDSFFEVKQGASSDCGRFKDYILDSGAFTFMNSGKKVDWDQYVVQYAKYVRQNGICNYIELDIDSIIGYEAVLKIRQRLQELVGWPPMPVWHVSRGKDDFRQMVKDYRYACVGGMAANPQLRKRLKPYLRAFIDEAHRNGCRLHGLGFTGTSSLKDLPFDSVDSTTWLVGEKYNNVCVFRDGHMRQVHAPSGKRLRISKEELRRINGKEWIKFQKYADTAL